MTSGDKEWFELLADGEFWDALTSTLADTMGLSAFVLVAGVPMMLALYSWTGTFLMPAIVLALFGGVIIALAPPQVALIGTLMVVVAVTITLLSIWEGR